MKHLLIITCALVLYSLRVTAQFVNQGTLYISSGTPVASNEALTNSGELINRGTLLLRSNLTNAALFDASQGESILAGSTPQTISGPNSLTFQKLTIRNTSAGEAITINSPVNVTNLLNLETGVVRSAGQLLLLGESAQAVGGNDGSHVVGTVRKTGNTAFVFPLGNGSVYRPAYVAPQGSPTMTFSGSYLESAPLEADKRAACLQAISDKEYWLIDGSGSAQVGLPYQNVATSSSITSSLPSLRVARFGSVWEPSTCAGNGGTSQGFVLSNEILSQFGQFTLGKQGLATTIATQPASASTVCLSGSVTVAVLATGENLSYQWKKDGNSLANQQSATLTLSTVTAADAGTYAVEVTGTYGTLTSSNFVLTVGQPVATLTAFDYITCARPTVTLTATGGASYALSDGQTSETGVFTVSKGGEYTVTATTAEGCIATSGTTVLAYTQAPSVTLANDGPISCTSPAVKLTASPSIAESNCGAISYAYSGPGLVDPMVSYGTAEVNAAGVYSVTITDGYGCTATAETTVEANQDVPAVTLTSDGGLSCTKPSVLLTATGGVTYLFEGGVDSQQENTAVVTKAGTYTVKATAANGCSATKQIIVTGDQALPTVGLLSSGSLSCAQPASVLTASGGQRYQFSSGASQIDNGPTASVVTAGLYSVTVTAANGCTAVATTTVTGDQTAPAVTLSTDGLLSCTKTSVLLTANGNGTYRFSSGATQIENGNTASVTTAGVYSVTVTSVNGCSATAQTTVTADQTLPLVSLNNDGPLSCTKTSVLLTASGEGTYRFSTGATQIESGNTATVATAGTYSVTVTSANGCSAVANTTVIVECEVKAPVLTASATTTQNQPIQVTASGCEGTVSWTVMGGIGLAQGAIYIVSQPGNYTLSARCTVGTTTSVESTPIVVSIRTGTFAITSVNTINCRLIDASRGEYGVTFTPVYSGLEGTPASFSIINEIVSTTATAPYTVRLYADNPVVTLVATQANGDAAQFSYSWRAICASNTTENRPPVVSAIPVQQLVQEQPYQLDLTAYFADPDGQVLTFSTSPLPTGLSLSGGRISGVPTITGVNSVTVTALDSGGMQVASVVRFSISAATATPTADFAITGVQTVTCVAVSASERRVSFSPLYSGLNGTPIRFRVVNEIDATTDAGPYAIRLYTDNPVVKLEALQSGVSATYSYAWLNSCTNPTPPVVTNRPPVVSIPLVSQTATVGQGYSLYISRNTFTDPDGGALILSAEGLPAGLSYSTSLSGVTGTPATIGTSTIRITATDPGGLSVSSSFELTVIAAPVTPTEPPVPPTSDFAITGVSTVTCVVVSASERRVSFSPLYSGLNGTPIRFRVVNEIDATTDAGPYAIRLYTDNPVVKLEALQSGVSATYSYAWLNSCATPTPPTTPTEPTLPVTPPSAEFAITGVTTVSCEVVTASERRVTFTPQYAGAASGPISFQVVNEVGATTAAGPYTIRLYTDNPVVTLRAEQASKVASFRYEWLNVCNPNGRQGALESVRPLAVTVFGNPVVGESAEVAISGAEGQALQVVVVDLLGNAVHQQSIRQAAATERLSLPLGRSQGLLFLHVSTPSQQQQIKLLRP